MPRARGCRGVVVRHGHCVYHVYSVLEAAQMGRLLAEKFSAEVFNSAATPETFEVTLHEAEKHPGLGQQATLELRRP